jgi:hypothetical protein
VGTGSARAVRGGCKVDLGKLGLNMCDEANDAAIVAVRTCLRQVCVVYSRVRILTKSIKTSQEQ